MKPNRAILGSEMINMAVLTSHTATQYEISDNMFFLKDSDKELEIPPFILSGANYRQEDAYTRYNQSRRLLNQFYGNSLESTLHARYLKRLKLLKMNKNKVTLNEKRRNEAYNYRRRLQIDNSTDEGEEENNTVEGTPIPNKDEARNELFEDGRDLLALPYLPFFSNCTFFGSYIFLYPLLESHPDCSLVPEDQVVPISYMKFGMQPIGDVCEDVVLQCSYTEDVKNFDESKKYWFNAEQDSTLFQFLEDPINPGDYEASLSGSYKIDQETVTYT